MWFSSLPNFLTPVGQTPDFRHLTELGKTAYRQLQNFCKRNLRGRQWEPCAIHTMHGSSKDSAEKLSTETGQRAEHLFRNGRIHSVETAVR